MLDWVCERWGAFLAWGTIAVLVVCVVLVVVVMPVLIVLGVDVSIHNNDLDHGKCPGLSDCSAYTKTR